MSKLSEKIFKGEYHKVTSVFGKRSTIKTASGTTSTFHSGTDYGTANKNTKQYAVTDGYVFASAKASDGAYYVWVIYPVLKKAMLHYHLKEKSPLKAGAKVKEGTLLGLTGMSGKATGIHLHLGIRDLAGLSDSKINDMTWAILQSCPYIDPEVYGKDFSVPKDSIKSFLPARGYIKFGDQSDTVGRIASFMRKTFTSYTPIAALGNLYGKYIQGAIKEFQRRTGLTADGCIGPITLSKLIEYGLKL